jgi:hypothetical protein
VQRRDTAAGTSAVGGGGERQSVGQGLSGVQRLNNGDGLRDGIADAGDEEG